MQTTIEGESGSEADDRVAPRQRVLIAGTIRYTGGMGAVPCVVRNLSETGAKLTLSESVALPTHFDLVIAQKNVAHRCELRWRRGEEAGVAFLDAPESADPGSPAAAAETPEIEVLRARIRTLEAENVRLKGRIAQLAGG